MASRPAKASSSRRTRRTAESRDPRRDGGPPVRRRRRAGRARGMPRRAGSLVLRDLRRHAARCRSRRRRITSGSSTTIEGPNTGGMGAFAPSPLIDEAMQARGHARDRRAGAARACAPKAHEYRGFLYAGLMLTCDGPKVIEFNVRFGDPEAQVVMPLIDGDSRRAWRRRPDGDSTATARVHMRPTSRSASCSRRRAIRVRDRPGVPIAGLDAAAQVQDVTVFHAGTAQRDGADRHRRRPRADVVGRGGDIRGAIARAYEGVAAISVRRHAVPPRHRPQGAIDARFQNSRLPKFRMH